MKKNTIKGVKAFECIPRCEFPKIEGVTFSCDKCIKHIMLPLTQQEKEQILLILDSRIKGRQE